MFMIFTAAADDGLESIVESAFENVEQGKNVVFLLFKNSVCCFCLFIHVLLTYVLFLLIITFYRI